MASWSDAPFLLYVNMLSPNETHNPLFRLVTVDVLPPLPLPSMNIPLPFPPRPQMNFPPLPLMMVSCWYLMMNLLSEVR